MKKKTKKLKNRHNNEPTYKKSVAIKIQKAIIKKTGKKPTPKELKKVYYKRLMKFYRLAWEILEHKFRYYEGAKYNLKPISDEAYDEVETKYKKMAKFLEEEPTASNHVGFPFDTPSGRLVISKLVKQ